MLEPAPLESGTQSTYEVARPTLNDLPRLLELWKGQYDYHHELDPDHYKPFNDETRPAFEQHLRELIESEGPRILIAGDGGNIGGFITFEEVAGYIDDVDPIHGEIVELFTDPKLRGRGLGKMLKDRVVNDFTAKGLRTDLNVAVDNPARGFYEREGFETSSVTLTIDNRPK